MKTWKRWALGTSAFLAMCLGVGIGSAQAGNTTSYLSIDVTVQANLSVAITGSGNNTSTEAVTWTVGGSTLIVNTSSTTVINDSGGQVEKWALSTNATSLDLGDRGSPGTWSRTSSTAAVGTDQFAVQAVFGSSNTATGAVCPVGNSTDWSQAYAKPLDTTTANIYTDTLFSASSGDTVLNNLGGTPNPDDVGGVQGRMSAGSKRALCYRIVAPSATSTVDTQNVQILITASNP